MELLSTALGRRREIPAAVVREGKSLNPAPGCCSAVGWPRFTGRPAGKRHELRPLDLWFALALGPLHSLTLFR